MKKIVSLLLLITLISCSSKKSIPVTGQWGITHVIVNDEQILEKNISPNNLFNVPLHEVSKLFLKDKYYVFVQKNGDTIQGSLSLDPKLNKIRFFESDNKLYNGYYSVNIERVMNGNIEDLYFKLESKNVIFYGKKMFSDKRGNDLSDCEKNNRIYLFEGFYSLSDDNKGIKLEVEEVDGSSEIMTFSFHKKIGLEDIYKIEKVNLKSTFINRLYFTKEGKEAYSIFLKNNINKKIGFFLRDQLVVDPFIKDDIENENIEYFDIVSFSQQDRDLINEYLEFKKNCNDKDR